MPSAVDFWWCVFFFFFFFFSSRFLNEHMCQLSTTTATVTAPSPLSTERDTRAPPQQYNNKKKKSLNSLNTHR